MRRSTAWRRPTLIASGLLIALTTAAQNAAPADAHAAAPPAEPPGLWTGPMVSTTPTTLQGAQVIDLPALERLMATQPTLLIDVGPADRKPDQLPAGTLWRPTHRSIPNAHWFPGAGRGDLSDAQAEAWVRRIDALTQGQRDRPIVTFCKPSCWGSWNAGKRLVQAGYSAVYWFPAGVHGWQEGHETAALEPEPGWALTPP